MQKYLNGKDQMKVEGKDKSSQEEELKHNGANKLKIPGIQPRRVLSHFMRLKNEKGCSF